MKIFRKLGRTARRATFYDTLKGDTQYLWKFGKEFVQTELGDDSVGKSGRISDLGLTAAQLDSAKRGCKKVLTIFLVLAALVLLYLLYNVFAGNWRTVIVSVALLVVCLAQSFKYHFWLYQMKVGRLGCHWREWLDDLIKRPS